jgi:hypothetical protein
MKIKIITLLCFFILGLGGRAYGEEEELPPAKGMAHKEKSGVDDDRLNEIKDWEVATLYKLTAEPDGENISPDVWQQKLKAAQDQKDPSKLACVYLNLSAVAEFINRTGPSLRKYTPEDKEKWATLEVLSKQVIGEETIYKVSDDLTTKLLKNYSQTKCGKLAPLEKIAFAASGINCEGKEYARIIKLGLEYLKNKALGDPEKALTHYFLAKAYQTEWALAFYDQTEDDNPQDYVAVHPQAKIGMVKYLKLLKTEVPSRADAIDHVLKRIDARVNLGADYDCHQAED